MFSWLLSFDFLTDVMYLGLGRCHVITLSLSLSLFSTAMLKMR